jgi:hypothetical protein
MAKSIIIRSLNLCMVEEDIGHRSLPQRMTKLLLEEVKAHGIDSAMAVK